MTTDSKPLETLFQDHGDAMRQFRQQMEDLNGVAIKIKDNTIKIVRIISFFLALLAIYIIYQIQNMTKEMSNLGENMIHIHGKFEKITFNLRDIKASLTSINQDIHGLPILSQHLSSTNLDVGRIQTSVGSITKEISSMDQNLLVINQGVNGMVNSFVNVNWNMFQIDRNTGHIARPTDLLSPFHAITPP